MTENKEMAMRVDVVRFIAEMERAGIVLSHCAPFIREWMPREGGRLD